MTHAISNLKNSFFSGEIPYQPPELTLDDDHVHKCLVTAAGSAKQTITTLRPSFHPRSGHTHLILDPMQDLHGNHQGLINSVSFKLPPIG